MNMKEKIKELKAMYDALSESKKYALLAAFIAIVFLAAYSTSSGVA